MGPTASLCRGYCPVPAAGVGDHHPFMKTAQDWQVPLMPGPLPGGGLPGALPALREPAEPCTCVLVSPRVRLSTDSRSLRHVVRPLPPSPTSAPRLSRSFTSQKGQVQRPEGHHGSSSISPWRGQCPGKIQGAWQGQPRATGLVPWRSRLSLQPSAPPPTQMPYPSAPARGHSPPGPASQPAPKLVWDDLISHLVSQARQADAFWNLSSPCSCRPGLHSAAPHPVLSTPPERGRV